MSHAYDGCRVLKWVKPGLHVPRMSVFCWSPRAGKWSINLLSHQTNAVNEYNMGIMAETKVSK